MNIKRFIEVSFQKEGIHCYPAAATDPTLATGGWDDVSWLSDKHRHIFHFYVRISVNHSDREIEFIQAKRYLERLFITDGVLDIDFKSCEMLAEDIINEIDKKWPGRSGEVRVFEDNENGAVLEFTGE